MQDSITRPLGGEYRTFHLSNDGWEIVQNNHKQGPWEMLINLGAMRGKTGEVIDLVKFGLIGGGMDEGEAIKLMELTFVPSKLNAFYDLAHEILTAYIGPNDEDDEPLEKQKPLTEAAATR